MPSQIVIFLLKLIVYDLQTDSQIMSKIGCGYLILEFILGSLCIGLLVVEAEKWKSHFQSVFFYEISYTHIV